MFLQSKPCLCFSGSTAATPLLLLQIYKNYLTNKVLRDPRQRRFFTAKDISDLFTLNDDASAHNKGGLVGGPSTETAKIFQSIVGEEFPAGVSNGEVSATVASSSGRLASQRGVDNSQEAQETPAGRFKARAVTSARRKGKRSMPGSDLQQRGDEDAVDGDTNAAAAAGETDDAKVLRDLFEGTGIRSLIDHSRIEGANDPETLATDLEANKIAQRAADALRASRQQCQTVGVHVPTWTGRHGRAGAVGGRGGRGGSGSQASRPRFGTTVNPRLKSSPGTAAATAAAQRQPKPATVSPQSRGASSNAGDHAARQFSGSQAGTTGSTAPSSAALLARMRQRQQLAVIAGSSEIGHPGANGESSGAGEFADVLAAQVVSFLESVGGEARSEVLVNQFQSVVDGQHMPLFRQLLKKVALLQRRPGSGGIWVLRPEFSPTAVPSDSE